MTLPPHRVGDMGQRFVVQTTGWPNRDAMGWQNAVYADTHEGATKAMQSIGECPGVRHIRIRDRIEDHPEDPDGRKLADLVEGLRADAQGTPTRSAETTGSVGEADGGPVAESDAPETQDLSTPLPSGSIER